MMPLWMTATRPLRVGVRVRVAVGRPAVGRPAGVTHAGLTRSARPSPPSMKCSRLASTPAFFAVCRPPCTVQHGDARRVVAAVLEPAQPLEDERERLTGTGVSDDAAHDGQRLMLGSMPGHSRSVEHTQPDRCTAAARRGCGCAAPARLVPNRCHAVPFERPGPSAGPGQSRRKNHAEPGHRQPQHHLSGGQQIGDLRGAEHLEFGQPGRGSASGPASLAGLQLLDVEPDLLPRLPQKALGAEPVQRLAAPGRAGCAGPARPSSAATREASTASIRSWSRRRRSISTGSVKSVVADHREHRLRQVVVDVRVDAEQHVPQRWQVGGRVEGQPPGPRAPARVRPAASRRRAPAGTGRRTRRPSVPPRPGPRSGRRRWRCRRPPVVRR